MAANPVRNDVVVAYENGDLAVIDMNSGNKNIFYQNAGNAGYSVTYSPDGKRLAVSGNTDNMIRIWDTTRLSSQMLTFTGHTGVIRDLQFSHDGKQLASGSLDKTVRLWNMTDPTRQPIVLLDNGNKPVWSVAFSADDNYLFAGTTDKVLKKWPTKIALYDSMICEKITRNMIQKEWNDYVGENTPYQKTCPKISN